MQTLQFEQTWERSISAQDRLIIAQAFEQRIIQEGTVHADIIRTAYNHRGELLVTVLIHNETDYEMRCADRAVTVQTKESTSTQRFTEPKLVVPNHSSMPWTFIFKNMNVTVDEVLSIQF